MTLNQKNCKRFINDIDYLCRAIRPARLEVSSQTIEAIARIEHRANDTELWALFSLGNFLLPFVPNFASPATLLNEKLREGQQQTFEGLVNI